MKKSTTYVADPINMYMGGKKPNRLFIGIRSEEGEISIRKWTLEEIKKHTWKVLFVAS